MKRKILSTVMAAVLIMTGCAGGAGATTEQAQPAEETAAEAVQEEAGAETEGETAEAEGETDAATAEADAAASTDTNARIRGLSASEFEPIESENGNIVILYTNDVHCAVDKNIGYSGLEAYKKAMEEEGNAVFLVDDGDAIQGGVFGSLTKGESIINIMNDVGYDLAIPGNHEFDYGVPQFMELVQSASFPYICCNFENTETGDIVFDSYMIREIGGKRIGFVGATTPSTITSSTPAYFKNEQGEFIYDFIQSADGTEFYQGVQDAVDAVNAEGVDYTVLVAHLGVEASSSPYTSVELIHNTTGIDLVLDGHSHTEVPMEEVKNKNGENVVLTQSGTQLEAIGKVTIDQTGSIKSELVTEWDRQDEGIIEVIQNERAKFEDIIADQIAYSDFDLAAKEDGVWLVRNNESNMGDLFADALKYVTGAEIGLINGGGVRSDIPAGEIIYGDLLEVAPYSNEVCCIKCSGQVIADALEYSVHKAPDLMGGFLQVSGITFDIDLDKNAQVQVDGNKMFTGFGSEERRVSNIMVNGEPLDLEREYTVGGIKYVLMNQGDGYTIFDDCEEVELERYIIDVDALAEYMSTFGGTVPEEYADRYGQERIHFLNE